MVKNLARAKGNITEMRWIFADDCDNFFEKDAKILVKQVLPNRVQGS